MMINRQFPIYLIFILSFSPAICQVQLKPAFPNLFFTRPVDLQDPGDSTNRLFVVEQSGRIKTFQNDSNVTTAATFLDITDRVDDGGNEEGLLGLAFHPDYTSNGYFYVNYTAASPNRTVIARYSVSQANPDSADKSSEFVLLEYSQPYSNHNGGQVSFGPDGYLYIAAGDGGSGGDPQGNGQNPATLLGSILRIDVDSPNGNLNYSIPADNPFYGNSSGYREEIYAYGLRNPWRFSFDSGTGRLWAADVGQNTYEEVNIIESGKNFGWNIMEGFHCYSDPNCDTTGLALPVWEYDHGLGSSITGGYVYRGSSAPELFGKYLYADYVSGRIWTLEYDGINPPVNTELMNTSYFISSFGADQNQELYICAFDGSIYRFVSVATSIRERRQITNNYELNQNYPNPFNGETVIPFNLTEPAFVKLEIFDTNGQRIKTLVNRRLSPSQYRIHWQGTDQSGRKVSSGIYYYRLSTEDEIGISNKMLLIK